MGLSSLTDVETAYIAGIIDGEGCLQVRLDNNWLKIRIEVGSTDPSLTDWLVEKVGGNVNTFKRPRWKQMYMWRAHGKLGVPLLEQVLPYLIIKRKQAELVLELAATRHTKEGRNVPSHVQERRLRLVADLSAMKARGVAA